MLFFTPLKAAAVVIAALVVCLFAALNFFPEATLKALPKWAQRHVAFSLNQQGGSHILLEVDSNDLRRQQVRSLLDDVRRTLREARIANTNAIRGETVEVRLREGVDPAAALA